MINEVTAKSILRRRNRIESWFMTHYGMNLYQGCSHNCVYCDGRAEQYYVNGEFGKDITVKVNAIELLTRELDPSRKRTPMPKSFMLLGGGVCDAYQPIEAKYQLARQALELMYHYGYPVHILTKSTLVERDLDLLLKINEQSKAVVSFSFSSTDDTISRIFEPGVRRPTERLATIRRLREAGISCGMFLMPVIPMITDTSAIMKQTLDDAKAAGVRFVIFGGMTLKPGRQKEYFMRVLTKEYPDLAARYELIYPQINQWGTPGAAYDRPVNELFDTLATDCNIPKRMPPEIYGPVVSKNDMVIVILEHLDYLCTLKKRNSPYGYAAYSLAKISVPIETLSQDDLLKINGIGNVTAEIIREIIQTGRCRYYEQLL